MNSNIETNFSLIKHDFYDWHSRSLEDKFYMCFRLYWGKGNTFEEGYGGILEWCTLFISRYLTSRKGETTAVETSKLIISFFIDTLTFIVSVLLSIFSIIVILPIHLYKKLSLTEPMKNIMNMSIIMPKDFPQSDFFSPENKYDHCPNDQSDMPITDKQMFQRWKLTLACKGHLFKDVSELVEGLDNYKFIISPLTISLDSSRYIQKNSLFDEQDLEVLAIYRAHYCCCFPPPHSFNVREEDFMPIAIIPINKSNKKGILALLERVEKIKKFRFRSSNMITNTALESPNLADDIDQVTHFTYSYVAQNSKRLVPTDLYQMIAQYTFSNNIQKPLNIFNAKENQGSAIHDQNNAMHTFFKPSFMRFRDTYDINEIIATGEAISMKK